MNNQVNAENEKKLVITKTFFALIILNWLVLLKKTLEYKYEYQMLKS